jgi:RHS repeat-associated protein
VQAQASYAYDGVGNRTSLSSGGAITTSSYNSLDQLTSTSSPTQSASYTYDGRGNLTTVATTGSGGSNTTNYAYNAANELTGVTLPTGTSSSYTYNANGRQVSQTTGGVTTNYLWDAQSSYGDIVLETDGTSGAVQASYTLGGADLLAQTRGGTVSYTLPDGQGSVRQLANSSGSITDTYRYGAYGNVLSHTGSTTVMPYGYDSQRLDATSGLYQLRPRTYDPTTRRFLTPIRPLVDIPNPVELVRSTYAAEMRTHHVQ